MPPRVLVLDDPLSALDVHTEAQVEAARGGGGGGGAGAGGGGGARAPRLPAADDDPPF